VRVTNAFRLGFWAFFGAFAASLLFWIAIFLFFVFFAGISTAWIHASGH
jgi:hypothetical protein